MDACNLPRNGQTCTFQILFTSDVHAAFQDYSYALDKEAPAGGLSKLATLMRSEKADFDGESFIVDVGDIIQGNATGPLVKLDKFGKEQPGQTIQNDVVKNWSFVNLDWDETLRAKAIAMINGGQLSYDFTKPVQKNDIVN